MLKEKATKAVVWSAIEQLVRQTLFFGVSIVMARLVAPEAYGIVALLTLFTALATVFVDGGLTTALVQRRNTTNTDESTVFWFNVCVAGFLTMLLFIAAPWISSFYELPVLKIITRIYAFQILLGACNSVHHTLFIQNLDLKTPLKINVISGVISATVGIVLAVNDFQMWALVAQAMTLCVARTLLIWTLSSWRPAFVFSVTSFKNLFSFGGFIFLSRILEAGYSKLYTLLIGKWYGAYDLGLYGRAEATSQLPTQTLTGILNRVAFPIFSQANDDPVLLRKGLRMAVRAIMFINIPTMLGLIVIADPLILTLFGPAWSGSAAIMSVIAIGGIFLPLHTLNISMLEALGHSAKVFKVEMAKKIVGITLILIGVQYGILGIAWAMVASSVFAFISNAYYSGRYLNYGVGPQTRDLISTTLCSLAMAAFVYWASTSLDINPVLSLVVLILIGITSYLSLSIIFRFTESKEILTMLKNYRKQQGSKQGTL